MQGFGRKFRRLFHQLRQSRPWRPHPSLAAIGAAAPGAGLPASDADFVVLSHPELKLFPGALRRIAAQLARDPHAEAAYTDEEGFYKPDWSPELLRSTNYPGPLCVLRPSLLAKLGGAPPCFDEAGSYELWLRIAEHKVSVTHVPAALFSRPQTASASEAEDETRDCRSALSAHGDRVFGKSNFAIYPSPLATVLPGTFSFFHALPPQTLVSLIIPTKDGLSLLEPCVRSILERSTHPSLEILILNNNSEQVETLEYFERVRSGRIPYTKVLDASFPFNWSRLNNIGAAAAQGEVLVFMNNDMEVIASDWLEWLGGYALREDIGVVGAQLLRADETLQHAGVVLGLGGWCDHIFDRRRPDFHETQFVSPSLIRNVSAVTGACMAIESRKFRQVGGFDEAYQICGSDIEYCLRLLQNDWRNVYLPPARLFHLESQTRDSGGPDPDRHIFRQLLAPFRWQGDPFFNENLSLYDNRGKIRSRWE